MRISAHVLLKNEARFAWYSIMSVIKHVDRIRIWNMGSTDETGKIVETISKTPEAKKLDLFDYRFIDMSRFEEDKIRQQMLDEEIDPFSVLREEMLETTNSDWVIVVDADEIWWNDSIKELTNTIREKGNKIDCIVVPTINLVGDMYHCQEKEAGRYHLAGRVGHYNLRAVNRSIPGLKYFGVHGISGLMDKDGNLIQNRDQNRVLYLNTPYLHATNLQRSINSTGDSEVYKRAKKRRHEIGIEFPKNYYYPEVFFKPKPDIVPTVWKPMTTLFKIRSLIETPLRKIYRRTLLKFKKHGY